jgi:large subunit ribosomal protein L18
MDHHKKIDRQRKRRAWRVRKHLGGDAERPRLCVARSNKHIAVQIINDQDGKTLMSASTHDKEIAKKLKSGGNKEAATAIGREIAKRATQAGITTVRFDRGPFKYHGRVAALAEAAREAGLKF